MIFIKVVIILLISFVFAVNSFTIPESSNSNEPNSAIELRESIENNPQRQVCEI